MSWKTTITLGVTALLVGIAVFLLKREGPPPDAVRADFLPGIEVHQVKRVSISKTGENEILLERDRRPGTNRWQIESPIQKIANEYLVMEMLRGLFGARRAPFHRPGHPDYATVLEGFDGTGLEVGLETDDRSIRVHFGKRSKLQADMVWLQVDDEPNIYLVSKTVLDLFTKENPAAGGEGEYELKPVKELRSKQIVGFESHLVKRIRLKLVSPLGSRGEYDEEKSLLEKRENGWYLAEPFEERLKDSQVNALLGGFSALVADDFLSVESPGDHGTGKPVFRAEIEYAEGKRKFVYCLGKYVDKDQKQRYVWTEPVDEVAKVAVERYLKHIPQTRNSFRSGRVIDWTPADTKRIEIDYRGVGKVVLIPKRMKNRFLWVPENPDHPFDEEQSTKLGFGLFTLSLKDHQSWLGVLPGQAKALGLDPPELTLRFELSEGERILYFVLRGTDDAYMKKAWEDELYTVPSYYVKFLQKLDLSYRTLELWSVRPDQLTGIHWERRILGREPESWSVVRQRELDTDIWKWRFTDPESVRLNLQVDPDRAKDLLLGLTHIQAKKFIGKSPSVAKRFELGGKSPPHRLVLSLGTGGKQKVLLVGRNQSPAGAAPFYFARFEADPVVFQIDAKLIDLLIKGLVVEE